MAINIQSLFSDIIETPAQRQERMLTEGILRGRELTGGLTGLARTQAPLVSALSMQMPQRQEALRRGVGGMLGLDVRTESEKLQDVLKGVDPSKPESIIAAAQRVGELGMGAQAAQMRAMAAEAKAKQQAAQQEAQQRQQQELELTNQRASMLQFVELADIDPNQKIAFANSVATGLYDGNVENLISRLAPGQEDKFKVVGNNIWDITDQKWITPPDSRRGIEGITASQYDPQSISRYESAIAQAQTPEQRESAAGLLLPRAEDGWSWSKLEDEDRYVQRPSSGPALQEVTREINVANMAGRKQREQSQNVLGIIDDMKEKVSSGEAGTISGLALQFIPGTEEFSIGTDIDTLKANMGYNALQEARQASANGSSGFGQLTQRELDRLESLITSLTFGLKKNEFISRLNEIEESFQGARDRAKSDWTIDEWIGISVPEQPVETTVTTPSGKQYEIIAE